MPGEAPDPPTSIAPRISRSDGVEAGGAACRFANGAMLRGVAITLANEADSRKGLLNVMKGLSRYKSPGLVQLRLGVKEGDGYYGGTPKPLGPPGMGYHADPAMFENALDRFTKVPPSFTISSMFTEDDEDPSEGYDGDTPDRTP